MLIVNRGLDPEMAIVAGRDVDYASLRERHLDANVPCEWVESNHPSYILYTSGTTGKPRACSATLAAMRWRWRRR